LGLFLFFRQKNIAVLVLKLHISFGPVVNKATLQLSAESEGQPPVADTRVVLPLAFVLVAIFVVVIAGAAPHVVLEVTFVKLTITKQNFNLAVYNLVAIETRLDYFVRQSKQDAIACRFVISPFAAEQSPVASKLANAGAASLSIFEVPFVLVSIGVDQLARPVFNPFHD
jgi:hypothetical protein